MEVYERGRNGPQIAMRDTENTYLSSEEETEEGYREEIIVLSGSSSSS